MLTKEDGACTISDTMKVLLPDPAMSIVKIDLGRLSDIMVASIREVFDQFARENRLGVSGIFMSELGLPDQQLKSRLREYFTKLSEQRLVCKKETAIRLSEIELGRIESAAAELGIEVANKPDDLPRARMSVRKPVGPGPGY